MDELLEELWLVARTVLEHGPGDDRDVFQANEDLFKKYSSNLIAAYVERCQENPEDYDEEKG